MKGILVLEEASIIAFVRAGNVDAFADIVEYYQSPIQRYLYRLTGDYELARDLAQDTFIQAYKSILKTDSEISFKAWIYRIATNNALQFRRRKRLFAFIPFSGMRKSEIPVADCAVDVDRDLAVGDALRRVPEEQRACLVLHFVEGFRYREIAQTLGISEEAVRKRVARGSQEFRRLFSSGGGVR